MKKQRPWVEVVVAESAVAESQLLVAIRPIADQKLLAAAAVAVVKVKNPGALMAKETKINDLAEAEVSELKLLDKLLMKLRVLKRARAISKPVVVNEETRDVVRAKRKLKTKTHGSISITIWRNNSMRRLSLQQTLPSQSYLLRKTSSKNLPSKILSEKWLNKTTISSRRDRKKIN